MSSCWNRKHTIIQKYTLLECVRHPASCFDYGDYRFRHSFRSDSEQKVNVNRLDTEVSSLHKHVATLSQEVNARTVCRFSFSKPSDATRVIFFLSARSQVRNAIQVLQELASTNSCVLANRYHNQLPASNPNLPDSNQQRQKLQRSSSHPPEIFSWNSLERTSCNMVNNGCQTDDIMLLFQSFVRENPDKVLQWLSNDSKKLLPFYVAERKDDLGESRPRVNCRKNNIPEWMNETFPPPAFWRSHNHRYSVGDISESSKAKSQIISLPSTKSLKFHPLI